MRRTALPVAFSAGFHPQPKIAFGPPNSVGYESDSEYVEVEFTRRMGTEELRSSVAKTLPEGFDIVSVKSVPVMFPSLESLVNFAVYEVERDVSQQKIDEFFSRPEIVIEKMKKDGIHKINAKPLIRGIKSEAGKTTVWLRFGRGGNVKPEKIMQLLCGINDEETKLLRITRKALLIERNDGVLQDL
jgi:radical SAM-linked protein